jgi:hypothetical protein
MAFSAYSGCLQSLWEPESLPAVRSVHGYSPANLETCIAMGLDLGGYEQQTGLPEDGTVAMDSGVPHPRSQGLNL